MNRLKPSREIANRVFTWRAFFQVGFMLSLCLSCALLFSVPLHADDTAKYQVRINLEWSAATHPVEFPAGAHVSDVIGATHDDRYVMFEDGLTASSGLELLAENGRVSILAAELVEAERRNRVGARFTAQGTYQLPGTITFDVTMAKTHPKLSFVTMIAPSPDWFTGVAGIDLAPNGTWLDRVDQTLWAWDAGTDSGTTYAAPDADTQPRASVRLLATRHVLSPSGLTPIGRVSIARLP